MPASVFYAETLADAAHARLVAAITASAAGDPLHGVIMPGTPDWQNRWQEVPDGTLAALTVHASGERGDGISRQLPEFQVTATLHFNGFLALGRDDPIDLDKAVGQLVRAILDLLLEDPTFLKLFGWVESRNVEKTDAMMGKDSTRYDMLIFHIELELAGAQTLYTPRVPSAATPLQQTDIQTTTGGAAVESTITLPE
jgi:hypothetical protein